eukprot:CAMPEP_0201510194 /NCGR_PEP_ID=MMETSP0161_2-20130828/2991_1 /ASSEMBLY_ACC=CAM_ASM_000251 /TAXON_ID=180227 /ORGANISM="Neoparamoeba aestuarina, Strain SoJaBio B1-5/56/2" /LENGTH=268 /DNA_ID=CAMNT_0047905337 /DNA_START=97 /DNA_END=900 /DNA_ORIENTATION=+
MSDTPATEIDDDKQKEPQESREDVPVGGESVTESGDNNAATTETATQEQEKLSEDVLGGVGLMELATPPKSDSDGDEGDESSSTVALMSALLSSLSASPAAPELGQEFDDEVPKFGKVLEKHCYEYADYLSYPNLLLQQVKEADEAAETMLNRLDEVGALTDTVRTESANIRRQILTLLNDCQHLPVLFDLIDKLLLLTSKMQATLDKLEERVVEAEDANSYSLGSFLTYVGAKRSASETFRKPSVPNTKEYFDKVREDMIATQEQMS